MSRSRPTSDTEAALFERLITDPAFRAAFRRRPADAARRFGLEELARELDGAGKALHTLDLRESKSSLAGLLMAAAAEGGAAFEVLSGADAHLHAALPPEVPADRAAAAVPADAVPDQHGPPEPVTPAAPAAEMSNTAVGLPKVEPHHHTHDPRPGDDSLDAGEAADPAAAAGGYPGDNASQAETAAWMAKAARKAGLPPELPVMAALQESGLRNVRHGDRDSVGFFQMRASIWNRGEYRGYLDRPELQLRWFLKRAREEQHGGRHSSPEDYGRWAADVERCAAQYRGLYQRHLEQARRLIGAGHEAHGPSHARDPLDPGSDSPAEVHAPAGAGDEQSAAVLDQPGMMHNTGQALPTAHPVEHADAADAIDAPAGGSPGARMVAIARHEVGVAEDPPGSNNSPRIARYRSATRGAPGPGPWCAYFVSWVAHRADVPLGDQGQGFGSVDAVWAWARGAARTIPAHGGERPRPGDLIVWDEHIGLVEKVLPGGRIQTIEGNSGDHVARRVHSMSEPIVGYVRMRKRR